MFKRMKKIFSKLVERKVENTSRFYLEKFLEKASESIGKDTFVLDAGCGDGRYKELFDWANYESADHCRIGKLYANKITYICDLSSIPVESKRYDLVICTQVLEHISEPKDILQELFRVLKPGGKLWLSSSFSYAEHEVPYDFFRYTQFGLKKLLSDVGFQIECIEPLEGYYMKLSYELLIACRKLPLNSKSYGGGLAGGFLLPVIFVLKFLFLFGAYLFSKLDKRYKNTKCGYCKNYCAVAKKPCVDLKI